MFNQCGIHSTFLSNIRDIALAVISPRAGDFKLLNKTGGLRRHSGCPHQRKATKLARFPEFLLLWTNVHRAISLL